MESELRTNEEAMRESERQGFSTSPMATPAEPDQLAVQFSRCRRVRERLGALAADERLHTHRGYPQVLFASTGTCRAVQDMWRVSSEGSETSAAGEPSTPATRGSETLTPRGVHETSRPGSHPGGP
ncbi:hypothetical protein NHX12_026055 [Muraenolepis orangiensis]|uniref:Uncharacterized protein n=1 Tax=Muraenolepis orangiensis TaxID=630683 RepID=A0A9Q0IPX6_9TELE|nr:hypothetical protein NHX12_026055 [Muraenolepis orangiensis]